MLYIVGTPIGNLDDLSYRQAKIIAASDIILSEDTRSTGFLLQRIKSVFGFSPNPNQKLISYYKEKEFEKLPQVIEFLELEKDIALISQAGMPIISDPGSLLIKELIKRNIKFKVIPGPNAALTALIYSGFNLNSFIFLGFLPKKSTQIANLFKSLKTGIYVFYESPNRINKTLELIGQIVPNSDIVITRELTKKFEEIIRGKPKDLINRLYKGEITIAVSFRS